jgi:hypothetical protein
MILLLSLIFATIVIAEKLVTLCFKPQSRWHDRWTDKPEVTALPQAYNFGGEGVPEIHVEPSSDGS